MRLIMVGPPGSGKGTQAKLLSERHQLVHIGTGDIIREAIRLGTPAGKQAEPDVVNGRLVPDSLVNQLVAERFRRPDRPDRFVMDGYPRTVAQAESFDQVLKEESLDLDGVIFLVVDDEEILQRLSGGRLSCPNPTCGATYHVTKKPPRKPGVCDVCGTPLVKRDDDREETVRQRLEQYHQNTAGLIPHYRDQGLLHAVPGQGDIEAIYGTIMQALNRTVPGG